MLLVTATRPSAGGAGLRGGGARFDRGMNAGWVRESCLQAHGSCDPASAALLPGLTHRHTKARCHCHRSRAQQCFHLWEGRAAVGHRAGATGGHLGQQAAEGRKGEERATAGTCLTLSTSRPPAGAAAEGLRSTETTTQLAGNGKMAASTMARRRVVIKRPSGLGYPIQNPCKLSGQSRLESHSAARPSRPHLPTLEQITPVHRLDVS